MLDVEGQVQPVLVVTTADRRLTLLDPSDSFKVIRSTSQVQDSPILTYVVLFSRFILCGGMSGGLVLYDPRSDRVIAKRKDHSKYLVKLVAFDAENGNTRVVSAGWDRTIFVYEIVSEQGAQPQIKEPKAHINLATVPEAMILSTDPDSGKRYLVLARRDSAFLYFYDLSQLPAQDANRLIIPSVGKQNLAPYSNAWLSLAPAAMATCPADPSRVAVATSTVPHMKVLIVQLIFPKEMGKPSNSVPGVPSPISGHESALANEGPQQSANPELGAAVALQRREDAAVLLHCNAFAPQTQFSTPAIAWRPDGSGLWVNSDDGVVRGIEARTGKLRSSLTGHEPGSKIRCLWAGELRIDAQGDAHEEWIISGGFDQRLIAWRPPT